MSRRPNLSYDVVQRNRDGKFLTNNPGVFARGEPQWSRYRRFAYRFYARPWANDAVTALHRDAPFEPKGYAVVGVPGR